jgi:hypothetical protein
MISQPSQITGPRSGSMRPTFGNYFLRALVALGLVYYVALVVDLVLHPVGPGVALNGFSLGEATAERYIAVLIATGTIVVGAFIMRRVPGNPIGPLMIVWGAGYTGYETLVDYGSPLLTSLMHLIFDIYSGGVAFSALIVLSLIFPTGQVYPLRAGRWVTLYVMLFVIDGALQIMAQSPGTSLSGNGGITIPLNPFFVLALAPYYSLINAISTILTLLGLIAAMVSLILRYRAAHTRERQQIKWLVWITCSVVVLAIFDGVISVFTPANAGIFPPLVIAYLLFFYGLLGAAPAIAIGLAILRSRLWEIDIIINRTLVYGSLTALLAAVYLGLIFGLQALFQGLFHQITRWPS